MSKIAVLIPCYNEELTVEKVVSDFKKELPEADILPPDEAVSRYYLRCMVPDTPGVLRDLAGAMAEFGISVAQAIQKAEAPAESIPIVFMTHQAKTSAMRASIARMSEKGLLLSKPVYYRVL